MTVPRTRRPPQQKTDLTLVLEVVRQVKDDLDAGRESRATLHARLDEMVERLGKIETSIALAGVIDAQVRNELDDLKQQVAGIQPTMEEWKRFRALGLGFVGLLVAGGLSAGVAVSWIGEQAVTAIRAWLRIS